jgi:translation initiation factor IF-2
MRKIRIYDLAKELRMEAKVLIREARALGSSVKVPSNTVSGEVAEQIRRKYNSQQRFGEQDTAPTQP